MILEMNKNIILVALVALLLGGIGGYAIGLHATNSNGDKYHRCMANSKNQGMHQMHNGKMMSDNDQSMPMMDHQAMMVKSEKAFITSMIPHHQEAVDTAQAVIERGATTPAIKELVENIVIAQEQEIIQMKQWYQDWYQEAYVDDGKYEPMMRELKNLSGVELDQTFLEDMVHHHMGAIMMAQSVQPYIENAEITTLTKAIIESQTAEIQLMRQLLIDLE